MANEANHLGGLDLDALAEADALPAPLSAAEKRLTADLFEPEAPVPHAFMIPDDHNDDPTRLSRRMRPFKRRPRIAAVASRHASPAPQASHLERAPTPFRVISWQSRPQSHPSAARSKSKHASANPVTPRPAQSAQPAPEQGSRSMQNSRLEVTLKEAEAADARACDYDRRGDYNFAYDYYEIARHKLLECLQVEVPAGAKKEMLRQVQHLSQTIAELESAKIEGTDVRRPGKPVFDYARVISARKEAGSVKFQNFGNSSPARTSSSPLSAPPMVSQASDPSPPSTDSISVPGDASLPTRQRPPVSDASRSPTPARDSRAPTPAEWLREVSPDHPSRGTSAYVPADVDDPRALKSRGDTHPNFIRRPCYESSDIWHNDICSSSKSLTKQRTAEDLHDAGNPSWRKDVYWDVTGTYYGADAESKHWEIKQLRESYPRCRIEIMPGIDSVNDEEDDEEYDEDSDDCSSARSSEHENSSVDASANPAQSEGRNAEEHSCATCGLHRGPRGSPCFPCKTCEKYWYCSEPCLRMKSRCQSGSCALLSNKGSKRKSPEISKVVEVHDDIAEYIKKLGQSERNSKVPCTGIQSSTSKISPWTSSQEAELKRTEEAVKRSDEELRRLRSDGRALGLTTRPVEGARVAPAEEDRDFQAALLNSMSVSNTVPAGADKSVSSVDSGSARVERKVCAISYDKDRRRTIEYRVSTGPLDRLRWMEGFDFGLDSQAWAVPINKFWQTHMSSRFSRYILVYPEINVWDRSKTPY